MMYLTNVHNLANIILTKLRVLGRQRQGRWVRISLAKHAAYVCQPT